MRRIFYIVVIAAALSGCKRSELTGGGANGEPTVSFTAAFAANPADSKSTETAFENGDRVGVYLTKRDLALKGSYNAMDNKLFEYFSAGDSLAGVPNSVFYPDKTTPVAVYAYYPFAANVANALAVPFRVSSNLKASDLCYASLPSAAPSAAAQPLAFTHSLSRLSVKVDFSANDKVESVTSITILGVIDSCYLNLANGAITNGAHTADILGNTFILPPQVLHYGKLFRIECKMKGGATAEFHFEPTSSPLTLLQSKKHTITLVLSASGSIALSNNQTIADWTEVTQKDGMGEGIVDNTITLHWIGANAQFRSTAGIRLFILDSVTKTTTPVVISNFLFDPSSSQALASFTFNIKGYEWLKYPYSIVQVEYLNSGAVLIQSSSKLTGEIIYRSGDKITIANNTQIETVNIAGTEWCTTNLDGVASQSGNIYPSDFPHSYGKFFKWGSTFVYDRKSDADEGGGFREGEYTRGSSTTPITQSKNYDYFGLNGQWPGDPCKQLGEQYRTPTSAQIKMLHDSGKSAFSSYNGVNGWFFGVKAAQCNDATLQDGCLFFPAAGLRQYNSGAFDTQGSGGYYWSSSVYNADYGWSLYFNSGGTIYPEGANCRSDGFSVRCVKMPPSAGPPTVTIAGTKWTTANLTGTAGKFGDAANIKVADNPQDYGMFFKWAATFVYGRASSSSEGAGFVNGNNTLGSSTQPTAQSRGYDYGSPLLNGPHVGDPCQKLDSSYRTPTVTQLKAMYDSGNSGWKSYQGVNGWFFGPKATQCTNTVLQDGCLFFPAAGYRHCWTGSLDVQDSSGYYWSSSVYDAKYDWNLYFNSSGYINPEYAINRSFGFSVRCVQQ